MTVSAEEFIRRFLQHVLPAGVPGTRSSLALQTDGLVASHSEPSQDGPPRRYFELTELGKKALVDMNAHWDQVIESIRDIRKVADK